jgi:hypothetical protein
MFCSALFLIAIFIYETSSVPLDFRQVTVKYTSIDTMPRNILEEKIPTLSSEMVIHQYQYRPRGFSIETRRLSEFKVLVEFNYTSSEPYNKYVLRMRYHGHHIEYMTNKSLITMHEPNRVLLRNFPPASYVVCITLFPSMFASNMQVYPISSSDMCVDVVFGPEHSFRHNKTGLLSPLLLALALIHLLAIAMIQKVKSTVKKSEKTVNGNPSEVNKKKDFSLERFNYLMHFNREYAEAKHLARMFSSYEDAECDDSWMLDKIKHSFYMYEDTSSMSNNADSDKNFGDFDSSEEDKKKVLNKFKPNDKQQRT